jgi:hypothetical protein
MSYASEPPPQPGFREWQAFGRGVVLQDGRLVVASTAAAHTVKPSRDMLFRFAALEGAPDGDVLAYSQQWGLFDLCGHGVLRGHSWGEVPVSLLVAADRVRFDDPVCPAEHGEPLEAWRYWSREAGALVRVIARLQRWQRADEADLLILGEAGPWAVPDYSSPGNRLGYYAYRGFRLDTIEAHRAIAGDAITTWFTFTRASNRLVWKSGRPRLEFGGEGLLGGLGVQLLTTAAGTGRLEWCATCPLPLIVKRATKGPYYCQRCREQGEPQQDAHQRWYDKMRKDPARRAAEAERLRRYRADKKIGAGKSGNTTSSS